MSPLADDRFAEVFRRNDPRLVGVARRVLGDGHEAEDAVQEALLALRTDAIPFAGSASPGAPFIVWAVAYAACWCLLADRWFRSRDL